MALKSPEAFDIPFPMKRFAIFSCFVAVMAWGLCVHAYILPAKQILGFMSKQVGWEGTLVLLNKTVLYDPQLEGGMQELEATLYYKSPRKFRLEMRAPGRDQVQVLGPGGALTVLDGKIIGEEEVPFDHFKVPFLFRKKAFLADELSRLGVDLETVRLDRFKEKIAFVIGSRSTDETAPEVWIEKESFQPIRFVLGGEAGGPVKEIEYAEYRSVRKGKTYPSRILFYEDGNLVRMQVLEAYDLNAQISDDLFDIPYLRTLYELREPPPPPEEEMDEIKRSIRDFRKIFE